MRVGQTQRTGNATAGQAARRPGASGGVFQPSLATAPRKAASARGPAGVSSVDVIVALQGVEDSAERRKRAIRNASETLDVLDELKLGLLSGELSGAKLSRLTALLRDGGSAEAEPELEELLRGIDLRARVELAKLAKLDTRSG
jgi:hypothetical protein